MNYIDIMQEHNITVKELINTNPKIMYELDYNLVNQNLTVDEQVSIIEKADYDFRCYLFIRRLLEFVYDESNILDYKVAVAFLKKCDSWANHISDFQRIISRTDNVSAALVEIIDTYKDNENLVQNIVFNLATNFNLFLTNFNLELFEATARNDFIGFDSDEVTFLSDVNAYSGAEKAIEIFKNNTFRLIKDVIKKHIDTNEKTHMIYSIPPELFNYLSQEELVQLHEYVAEIAGEIKVSYGNHLLTRMDKAIDKETSKMIALKFGLAIPREIRETGDVTLEELKIALDLENPFNHIKNNEYAIIYNTENGAELEAALFKIENVIKSPGNLALLRCVNKNSRGDKLTDEWILELFEKHYDYVISAMTMSYPSSEYVMNLFVRYMSKTANKELAFNRFWSLGLQSHAKITLLTQDPLCDNAGWLRYLMILSPVLGKRLLARLLTDNVELQKELIV